MVEITIVVTLVGLALAFVTKSLYTKAGGSSSCGCEGKVCQRKKKKVM